eukprot:s3857_g1.t3
MEDEWTEGWLQKIWYILYTFLLFLVSLNILLAIIVESFLRAKQETEGRLEVKSLVMDIFALPLKALMGFHHGWPTTRALRIHFEATRLWKEPVTAKELARLQHAHFRDKESAAEFLRYNHWLLGYNVLDERGRQYEDYKRFLCEFISGAGRCSSLDFDMQSLQRQILKIQAAIRRFLAAKRMEKRKRQKMRSLDRRPEVSKGVTSAKQDLTDASASVIREFGQRLGIKPLMVEALLLMRTESVATAGTDTEENTWTGSESLASADDDGSSKDRSTERPSTEKSLTLFV